MIKNTPTTNHYELFENYKDNRITNEMINEYIKIITADIVTIKSSSDVKKFCIIEGISTHDNLITKIKDSAQDFFEIQSSESINKPSIEKCYFEIHQIALGFIKFTNGKGYLNRNQ